jgi:hypothetical protein
MAALTFDLSGLTLEARERVIKHLHHEDAAKLALAQVRQAQIAQFVRDVVRPGMCTGLLGKIGRMTDCIDPGILQQCAAQFGHETAYQDPEFRPWLRKRYEAVAVPDVRTTVGVGWTPELEAKG